MVRIRKTWEAKTFKAVFDNFTNVTILKLISKGQLDGLESPISIGKEANLLWLGTRRARCSQDLAHCHVRLQQDV